MARAGEEAAGRWQVARALRNLQEGPPRAARLAAPVHDVGWPLVAPLPTATQRAVVRAIVSNLRRRGAGPAAAPWGVVWLLIRELRLLGAARSRERCRMGAHGRRSEAGGGATARPCRAAGSSGVARAGRVSDDSVSILVCVRPLSPQFVSNILTYIDDSNCARAALFQKNKRCCCCCSQLGFPIKGPIVVHNVIQRAESGCLSSKR